MTRNVWVLIKVRRYPGCKYFRNDFICNFITRLNCFYTNCYKIYYKHNEDNISSSSVEIKRFQVKRKIQVQKASLLLDVVKDSIICEDKENLMFFILSFFVYKIELGSFYSFSLGMVWIFLVVLVLARKIFGTLFHLIEKRIILLTLTFLYTGCCFQ